MNVTKENEKRRLGVYAWFGYGLTLEESLRRIKDTGFDSVLLWWGEADGTPSLREQPELARRLGLTVENAHFPFDGSNALWLPGEAGQVYADRLITSLRECAESGVPTLVAHLTDGETPPPATVIGLDRLCAAADAAEQYEVTLAFENLRPSPHLPLVLDSLQGGRVGFCYDSGHDHCCPGAIRWLETYGSRLWALHLHDNDGCGDSHSLPFTGTTDWAAVSKTLAACRNPGAISLEIQAYPADERQMTPDAYLHRAYEAADRIRKMTQQNEKLPRTSAAE